MMKIRTIAILLVVGVIAMIYGQAPSQATATGPHQATLNYVNTSCTSTAPCNMQVYRATCTSTTACPTYSVGSSSWTALNMANLAPSTGPNGTTWVYSDKDPSLQDSTTNAWVATCTFVGGTTASGASPNYVGTTNNGIPTAPVLSSNGNSVN